MLCGNFGKVRHTHLLLLPVRYGPKAHSLRVDIVMLVRFEYVPHNISLPRSCLFRRYVNNMGDGIFIICLRISSDVFKHKFSSAIFF